MGQLSPDLAAQGASVVALAVTAVFSQQAFARSLGVDYPLVSDWGGPTTRAYGIEYDMWLGHAGLAKRAVFVVDTAGIIRYRWVTDDALVEPDLEHVALAVGACHLPAPAVGGYVQPE